MLLKKELTTTAEDSTRVEVANMTTENTSNEEGADYTSDGIKNTAKLLLTKEGEGNPVKNGTPDEYSIVFSNKKLPQLPIGCCGVIIIREGDLDGDSGEEFSVFQAPMNGYVYTMTTYSFKEGKWAELFKPFLTPTGCEQIAESDLKNCVFNENGKIYIMATDFNDESFKTIKTQVKML